MLERLAEKHHNLQDKAAGFITECIKGARSYLANKDGDDRSSFKVTFAEGSYIGLGGAESLETLEWSSRELVERAEAKLGIEQQGSKQ